MKKLCFMMLILLASRIYGGGEELNNTNFCSKEECRALSAYPFASRFKKIIQLMRAEYPDNPENFQQIRALVCSLKPHSDNTLNHPVVWGQNYLLREAINNDAKDAIKLLYKNWYYYNRFHELGQKTEFGTIDLDILAESFEVHKDPVGMLELLMSCRKSDKRFPKRDIPAICNGSVLSFLRRKINRNQDHFCNVLTEKVEEHNSGVMKRISEKLEKIRSEQKAKAALATFEQEKEVDELE